MDRGAWQATVSLWVAKESDKTKQQQHNKIDLILYVT